jgi:predicted RND superfamily exporter protein
VNRFLEALARGARARYKLVFAVFGVAVAISVALIVFRLSFDTDVLHLLPQEDPSVAAYLKALKDFGNTGLLPVAIELPEHVPVEPYLTFADELAARLTTLPEIKNEQHRLGNPEELLQSFFPKSLLFLDATGRREVVERLSDTGITNRVGELRRQLATPAGMSVKELAKIDPFGLADILLTHLAGSRGTLKVDWSSGYYLSRDHRVLLILAEPKRAPQDIRFDERLLAGANVQIQETLARWPSIVGGGALDPPIVELGGPYASALGDAALIKQDMTVNALTSALGVFVLFLLAFRRARSLLYAFVPLLSGLALAFGFAAAVFGTLSSVTSVSAALLIGLAIDFVIVSYGRYVEQRRSGSTLDEALVVMSRECGRAVIAGAVTTAATFYAFTFTEFTGLRQMGVLTGTGILLCMVSVLFLLPAMLAWSEDRQNRKQQPMRLTLHSFGARHLTAAALARPGLTLLIGLGVTVLALLAARRVTFDESMRSMRPTSGRAMVVNALIGERFGTGFDAMVLTLEGDSLDGLLARAATVTRDAQRLVASGDLESVSSVVSILPPFGQQEEVLRWLANERRGSLTEGRIAASFNRALAREGLRPEPFQPGIAMLGRALRLEHPVVPAELAATPQTRLLLDRYLVRRGTHWRTALYLFPPGNKWRREAPPEVIRFATGLGPGASLSGANLINARIRTIVLHDAWVAGVLGLVLVAIILWIALRSAARMLLALSPLFVGMALMLGAMGLLDVPMNFINIFVTTMIIGIGSDYGIYVVLRYGEVAGRSTADVKQGLQETGRAVAVAAVSTIVGFGSITFSHYPGLRSTGEVAVLGAFCTAIVAITLVPAFLGWLVNRRSSSR